MRYVVTVTIRLESVRGELDLDEAIAELVWKGMADLVNDGGADEVSHVDVDAEPEEPE